MHKFSHIILIFNFYIKNVYHTIINVFILLVKKLMYAIILLSTVGIYYPHIGMLCKNYIFNSVYKYNQLFEIFTLQTTLFDSLVYIFEIYVY